MDGHVALLRLVSRSVCNYSSSRCLNTLSKARSCRPSIAGPSSARQAQYPKPVLHRPCLVIPSSSLPVRSFHNTLSPCASNSPFGSLEDTLRDLAQTGHKNYIPSGSRTQNARNPGGSRTANSDITKGPNADLRLPADEFSHSTRFQDIPPPGTAPDEYAPVKLGPNVGRSVIVRGDLGLAMTHLRRITAANKVKQDARNQKFHERTGMKRKRLKRERFRKRFKEGFKRMIDVVMEMRKQGM